MTTLPMKKIEIAVLRNDIEKVLLSLGRGASVQFISVTAEIEPSAEKLHLFTRLQEARARLKLDDLTTIPAETEPPTGEQNSEVQGLLADVFENEERQSILERRQKEIEHALDALDSFQGLDLTRSEWENLSYLSVRVGEFSPNSLVEIEEALGQKAMLLPLKKEGVYAIAFLNADRFEIENLLEAAGFHGIARPLPELMGESMQTPGQRFESLVAEKHHNLEQLEKLVAEQSERASSTHDKLPLLLASCFVSRKIEEAKAYFSGGAHFGLIEGWLAEEDLPSLVQELDRVTNHLAAITISDVEETAVPGDQIPVKLAKHTGTKGFERMIANYGAPLYGTIDPTPFVSAFFVLFFAIMFGDLGQGFCIFLIGIVLQKGLPGFLGWKSSAPAFRKVGLASMVGGLLYGSCFSNESLLVPWTRFVSGWFGTPLDRLIDLQPQHGVDRLFLFFGIVVGLGLVLNFLGLAINLYNNIKLRRWEAAFFSKTGLAGACFYAYGVFFVIKILTGMPTSLLDLIGFLVPLTFLFLGQKHEPSGWGTKAVLAVVETIELFSYYLSNTLSFLRVGAFALSHLVLGLIFFTLADLIGHMSVVGPLFSILVMVAGNLLVIFLEGLIVSIQIVRLHYYEFFSKFFFETGVFFHPFQFAYKGEQS